MNPIPTWLIIDTSGRQGRLALADEQGIRVEARLDDQRRHARDLTGTIQTLTEQLGIAVAQLAGVMVSIGPGSYTGLRVGVISAKVLAYATGCRLIGVPTFEAIAQRHAHEPVVEVIGDAQQKRVYYQRFEQGQSGSLSILSHAEWLQKHHPEALVTGPGVVLFEAEWPDTIRRTPQPECDARCEDYWSLRDRQTDADGWTLEPIYLRGSYAEEQAKK